MSLVSLPDAQCPQLSTVSGHLHPSTRYSPPDILFWDSVVSTRFRKHFLAVTTSSSQFAPECLSDTFGQCFQNESTSMLSVSNTSPTCSVLHDDKLPRPKMTARRPHGGRLPPPSGSANNVPEARNRWFEHLWSSMTISCEGTYTLRLPV